MTDVQDYLFSRQCKKYLSVPELERNTDLDVDVYILFP
jgi:hypothetical protein